jgi:hypothetical protein
VAADVSPFPYKCQVDAAANRLYLFLAERSRFLPDGAVGYIDLTDPGRIIPCTWFLTSGLGISDVETLGMDNGDFLVVECRHGFHHVRGYSFGSIGG